MCVRVCERVQCCVLCVVCCVLCVVCCVLCVVCVVCVVCVLCARVCVYICVDEMLWSCMHGTDRHM